MKNDQLRDQHDQSEDMVEVICYRTLDGHIFETMEEAALRTQEIKVAEWWETIADPGLSSSDLLTWLYRHQEEIETLFRLKATAVLTTKHTDNLVSSKRS